MTANTPANTAAVTQAVILVGGRGSRLGALTRDMPKPLMPVAGRPFLDHLLARLSARLPALARITLLAGYLGETIRAGYDGRRLGEAGIEVIIEAEPCGTGGALVAAADRLDQRFFLMNGDSLFDIDLADLASLAESSLSSSDGWRASLALRRIADTARSGLVETDGQHVTAFHERGPGGPGLINGGVYVLNRAILERITRLPCSLERDIFPALAAEGRLTGRVYDGYFIDIGIPADLERARQDLAAK